MGLFTDGFKLLKKASEPLYKTPKSIQETIEIMAVAENGIIEVSTMTSLRRRLLRADRGLSRRDT